MKPAAFPFTFQNLKNYFQIVLEQGYQIWTCAEFAHADKKSLPPLVWVNRVDIDHSPIRAKRLAEIFNSLSIRGTFFIRLHAREYNPFHFEAYRCLKFIADSGHEIGLHTETLDASAVWNEDPREILKRDLSILSALFSRKISGTASHSGLTGINNLDFWNFHSPEEFGLLYEGYDQSATFGLFNRSLYVSDSNWNRWKCYENGTIRINDQRNLGEHARSHFPLVYSLIHPETYYDLHPGETAE